MRSTRARCFDAVAALTFPLPATVAFSLIGVPLSDNAQLRQWCGHRAKLASGRPAPEEQVEHALNMTKYRRYLRDLVAAKVDDPGEDFATALLEIHAEQPEELTHEEIASIVFSLSFAGHETTNYLIGSMLRRLLEAPRGWSHVVSDPTLFAGAVDETLRYDPPVPVWRQLTRRAVGIAGIELPQGRSCSRGWRLPVATRAPSRIRTYSTCAGRTRQHLAFGKGIHFCIGSALGKLEAQLALEELTRRFPRLRLVDDQPPLRFHPNISFRGPLEMWVRAG
jgi:cytochrome P450